MNMQIFENNPDAYSKESVKTNSTIHFFLLVSSPIKSISTEN